MNQIESIGTKMNAVDQNEQGPTKYLNYIFILLYIL